MENPETVFTLGDLTYHFLNMCTNSEMSPIQESLLFNHVLSSMYVIHLGKKVIFDRNIRV